MSKSMVWDPVCPRCKMTVSADMWYNHMSVCRGRARSPGAIRNRQLQKTSAVAARAGPHGNPGPRSHPTTTKKVQATSKVCPEGGQKLQGTSGQPQRAQRQCLGASQDGYETTNRYPLEAKNQGAETLNQACCQSPPHHHLPLHSPVLRKSSLTTFLVGLAIWSSSLSWIAIFICQNITEPVLFPRLVFSVGISCPVSHRILNIK